ncbi:uncharacterized protein EI90DRAFT_1910809 [Cantharellus anzutake]|uniref:uncharacterized protein n=1 Tax=Cantharellus anzutake TaxID=1750568 RepID=UPI001904F71C|nr:uncharacterized protein EI90DRAFT_1910809 [Cantharellus anzutake]KAF8326596.1 hypothetical protein EI90DRAFT_1910809 [Cantharellus anzutake]
MGCRREEGWTLRSKSAWKGSDDLPTPEHGTAVIIKAFPFLRDLKIVSGTAHNSESNVRPWNFDPIAHAICGMTRLRSLNLGNDFGEAVNFTPSLVETCAMEIEELSICIRRQRDAAFCCHLLNGARKTLRCLSVLWGLPPRSEEHPTVTRDVISPVLQTGSYEHLTRVLGFSAVSVSRRHRYCSCLLYRREFAKSDPTPHSQNISWVLSILSRSEWIPCIEQPEESVD